MNGELKLSCPRSKEQDELRTKMLTAIRDTHCRAVSFKLSGVLTVMPVSSQSDLWLMMNGYFTELTGNESSFAELRDNAEEAVIKKSESAAKVKLEDIYSRLRRKEHISEDISRKLMQRECELVIEYSIPRKFAKEIYREAKAKSKRVIIVDDTCYPEDTIRDIIEKCGYSSCDGLVIMNALPKAASGAWIKPVIEKAGVRAEQLVHIGGDVTNDVEVTVLNGAKALLMQTPDSVLEKVSRVRGFCEREAIYDYDDPRYLALRCLFGLYSAYFFDIPKSKEFRSDFCGDARMLGFLVLGAQQLAGDNEAADELQSKLLSALRDNESAMEGLHDFEKLSEGYIDVIARNHGTDGCDLPLKFIGKCCGEADRLLLKKQLSPTFIKKWASSVTEPEIVPFYTHRPQNNALSRLADRMFPPGTKVRTITDNILGKMHLHSDTKKH